MNDAQTKFIKQVQSPFLFRVVMLFRLPSVAFWGATVPCLHSKECVVEMKHNFRNKNPFRSVYFGALAGGAELSTGLLCRLYLKGIGDCSMLVVKMEGSFHKKAAGRLRFVCDEGDILAQKIGELKECGDTAECDMTSRVYNDNNVLVADFKFRWSFKKRS